MKTRLFHLCAVLVLLACASGAWAQSRRAPTAKSIATLKQQAASGDANAQYRLGVLYDQDHSLPLDSKYKLAAYWYRKAADQGSARAEEKLSELYSVGWGVPLDYVQSAMWSRKAAEQGLTQAQNNMGDIYALGHGVAGDDAQAAYWYRRAAEKGDSLAQWSLGALYENGHGVPQDYAEAYFWCDLAVAGNLAAVRRDGATRERNEAASHLSSTELSRVQERARRWFEDHPATIAP